MKFEPVAAPHFRPQVTVSRVMLETLAALIPALLATMWFFGPGILINAVIATIVAVGCEAAFLTARGRPVMPHVHDLSAVLTAVLLAFALPPLTPWWVTATGAAFAIVVAKHIYGGLGYNPFNPAMAGYVVLLVSFPAHMTHWLPPSGVDLTEIQPGLGDTLTYALTGLLPAGISWDTIGAATPLDDVKTQVGVMRTVGEARTGLLYGVFGARGWEWIANFVAVGGFWLLYRKIIRWQIPVGFLLGVIVPATLFYMIDAGNHAPPTFHVFSGATMLGAFFIATDPVTAAASDRGRLIYGIGIGLLVYVIRAWGNYPDAVAFSVLLMNMVVPVIDRMTVPLAFGHLPGREHEDR